MLNTMKGFCELCKPFERFHCTIFVDFMHVNYFDKTIEQDVTLCDWNSNKKQTS